MENKTAKILLALALGGVAIWIIFRAKEALAAPEKALAVTPAPVEVKPKWRTEVTPEGVTVSYDSYIFRLPLFSTKSQDQLFKEAKEAEIAKSLGL